MARLEIEQKEAWASVLLGYNRIANEIDRRLKVAGAVSLSIYDVLLALEMAGGKLKMSDLASQASFSTSGITRAVDRIEQKGWIERSADKGDRRATWAELTPAGLAERKRAWPIYEAAIQELFGRFISTEEARNMTALFERMKTWK